MTKFAGSCEFGNIYWRNLLTKTRNELKWAKTSQNDPKLAETTQNQLKRPKKICKTNQNFKIRGIWNFLLAFVFQILSPNSQIWVFGVNRYQLPNIFNEILPVPYFEDANLKSDIGFWEFLAQISKSGYFVPKSINFLILAKIRMYSNLSVLISNLALAFWAQSPNLSNFDEKILTFYLNEIFLVHYFEGVDFKFDICFLVPRLHERSMSPFWTLFGKCFFRFFAKVSKYYRLSFHFLKVPIVNITLKKTMHIISLTVE